MGVITEFKILKEFDSYGIYACKLKESSKERFMIFTKNGEDIKKLLGFINGAVMSKLAEETKNEVLKKLALMQFIDGDEVLEVVGELKSEFLEKLEAVRREK